MLIETKENADGEREKLTDTNIKALLWYRDIFKHGGMAIAELIRHPKILAKAQAELDSPEPLEFRPERFLDGSEQAHIGIRDNDFEVIPFGLNLGIRTVTFLIATPVQAFYWELPEGPRISENLNNGRGIWADSAKKGTVDGASNA
ncbi:hypothetical protein IFM89_008126 [Coptis chinensis]|uniref:Uncharacterized protein n=1 Tax=Coptis chinensis TaxID=261450 RepID=A0A835M941_9MAGN|nr:hypothetical protein IFM89_008126 [Coptis chinensis]